MRLFQLGGIIAVLSFLAYGGISICGNPTTKISFKTETVRSEDKWEGHISGSDDELGIPAWAKTYVLTCRKVPGKAATSILIGQEFGIHVKVGVPFRCQTGKSLLAVDNRGKADDCPLGRGFHGMIGETKKGVPVLDITFEDAQSFDEAPGGGAAIESKCVRWIKKDFIGKDMEFVMRNSKNEVRWAVTMRFSGPNDSDDKATPPVPPKGNAILDGKVDSALEKLDRIEKAIDQLQRRLPATGPSR